MVVRESTDEVVLDVMLQDQLMLAVDDLSRLCQGYPDSSVSRISVTHLIDQPIY